MDKPSTHSPAHATPCASMHAAPRCRGGASLPWPSAVPDALQPDCRAASVLWQHAVHDMRGKLGVVTNLTVLLQRPLTEQRREALLAMLDRNVASLAQLLDGVADLARLDAVPESPALKRVNAAAVLQGVVANVTALAHSRGLDVTYQGPALLLAETDALMLERIAQNLILNAVRYTRSRGVVLSCASSDGTALERWCFEVRDVLAPADVEPHAALMLHTPPQAEPLPAGEGIGLSIVTRLSRALGGRVQTTSTLDGRVTRISLPCRPDVAQAPLLRSAALAQRHGRAVAERARVGA